MKFKGFIGPTRTSFSGKAGIERTVNLRLARGEDGEHVFYRAPGLLTRYNFGSNARVRGMLELNDTVYAAVGDRLIQLDSGFNAVANYGPIANDNRRVWFAASPTSLLAVSANTLYRLNAAVLTNLSTSIPLGFTPINIAFIQNYFVALSANLRQFYFDDADGATWAGGDVQTAEADANNLLALQTDLQTLFIYGNRITQAFLVGTNADAPFAVQHNAVISHGLAAAAAIATCGDYRYWIDQNKDGHGVIYRAQGYAAERVSTEAVEEAIRSYGDISDAVAWAYQQAGHQCVRFSFPSANNGAGATWEYDATEDNWTEPLFWNQGLGRYDAHRGFCAVSAFKKILVGDRENGRIYEMSPDYYSDDLAALGYRIRWMRRAPHVHAHDKRVEYSRFWLTAETGVGDGSALGVGETPEANPLIGMRYSDDGGKSYGTELYRSLGAQGTHQPFLSWERQGASYDRVVEISGNAAVKLCLTGAGWGDPPQEQRH